MLSQPNRYRNPLWRSSPNLLNKVFTIEKKENIEMIEDDITIEENYKSKEELDLAEENDQKEIIEIEDDIDGEDDIKSIKVSKKRYEEAKIKVENWIKNCKFDWDNFSDISDQDNNYQIVDNDIDSYFSSVSQAKRSKNANAFSKINKYNFLSNFDHDTPMCPEMHPTEMNDCEMPSKNSLDNASVIICSSVFKNKEEKKPLPWVQIKVRQLYDVNFTIFDSSDEFFVELADSKMREQLYRRLDKARFKLTELDDIQSGDYCLVESMGKLHRAMVHFHVPMSSMCLNVDTGEIFYFNEEKPPIYKMSSKIRRTIPFQVIRCSLYGLKLVNKSQWLSYINTRVLGKIQKPQIFVVEINETSDDNINPLKTMDEHKVILYDGADERNINDLLVELKLAEKLDTPINQNFSNSFSFSTRTS